MNEETRSIQIFKSGTHNLLDSEIIPRDAATVSKNWINKNGRIQLAPGKLRVGAEGVSGKITGEEFGYKIDGTKIHYRKAGTKIQYLNGSTWTDIITGLTSDEDYTLSNYSSLAGAFTFFTGYDGIWKINNANPASALAMYDATKNFKGYSFIDKGRMILWGRAEDKTGLYGSKIDPQTTNYTTITLESLATGNGSTASYAGIFGFKGTTTTRNAFAFTLYAPTTTTQNITGITVASSAVISMSNTTGLSVGDYVVVYSVAGMTQINSKVGRITALTLNTNITVDINSTGFSAYTSGGTVCKVTLESDNFLGGWKTLSGAINYVTGAWNVVFSANVPNNCPILVTYKWEDSNIGGLTDFSKSATRLAAEGFVVPQDLGGDAIKNVLIGPNGYYSMKANSSYLFAIDSTDLNPSNDVYNNNIGVPSLRSSIATSKGIIFMNTANPERPEMTILERNIATTDLKPKALFPQFDFALFNYDDCTINTFDTYILVACKTLESSTNDTILLCNMVDNNVTVTSYSARTFARDSKNLYMGSSIVESVYNLYNGYDDDGFAIDNFWTGKDDNLMTSQTIGKVAELKKIKELRLRGRISSGQKCEVYLNYDNSGDQLVGTILGTGSYVDTTSTQTVGANLIGGAVVGGDTAIDISDFYVEIHLRKVPKFKTRKLTFKAIGIGYVDICEVMDFDLDFYESKMPYKNRIKQNVSLDGLTTNKANP